MLDRRKSSFAAGAAGYADRTMTRALLLRGRDEALGAE
jgi:hypothetical protein